ncbi:universal stress protein [Actinacidiphila acidipaludis]|uniref:Universal stress protein n=1 Tax=Actinacidiphila acidipaludis TaxID=2873382 RepID=A0ABS7PZF3_9ACTN|nr:universal stress protein [Streptomyces acidipaludis]MBY8876266.1 universal stress protein [Streptomyces acidipaludis]
MGGLVVVGTDGSAPSSAAVAAAAREAARRDADLRVVHAFAWPEVHFLPGAAPPAFTDTEVHALTGPLLSRAVEQARAAAPQVSVDQEVTVGDALQVLVDRSREAQLVVVGSRGTGAFAGLLVGSTGVGLAAHAACPVLVVRDPAEPTGPVLVGVDGSPQARDAVVFAYDEAALRGASLLALHAWTAWNVPVPQPPRDAAAPYAYERGMLAADEERLLAEALAGCAERYPQVTVERRSVRAGTREALVAESARAQLLVVGARGRGGFSGLMLGSVSQAVLHHARCPMAVVRGGAVARRPD